MAGEDAGLTYQQGPRTSCGRRTDLDAVRDVLVTNGLDSPALSTVGYGNTRLVRPGAQGTADEAEFNRRVTFVIETPAGAATVAALSSLN